MLNSMLKRLIYLALPMLGAGVALGAGVDPAPVLKTGHEFDLRKFLAPFHSVVLHYPIGFVTLAFLLEIYSLRNRSHELRKVILIVMGLGALTSLLAAALGWFRATGGGYETEALERHRWFAVGVTGLTILGFVILVLSHGGEDGRRVLLGLHRVVLAGCLGALVVAGHMGGNLTHGSKYLFEGAPDFLKTMLAEDDPPASAESAPTDEKQKYFLEQIRPILEAKCYSCHGEEKQKGGYRLDHAEAALKGGESQKVAIKPGQPLDSNLIRLVLLPYDSDDVMPPAGKAVLVPEEIGKIVYWIQNGAVFVEKGTNQTALAPVAESIGR